MLLIHMFINNAMEDNLKFSKQLGTVSTVLKNNVAEVDSLLFSWRLLFRAWSWIGVRGTTKKSWDSKALLEYTKNKNKKKTQ